MTSRQLTILLALGATWGASFLFIKVLVDAGVAPAGVSAGRSTLGALTLLPLAWRVRDQFPRSRRTWGALAALGFINFAFPWTLFSFAAQHSPSGASSVVNALQPIWSAIFALALLKSDRMSGGRIAGLMLGFGGVFVLMGQDMLDADREGMAAILLMATATACYAFSGVFISRWLKHVKPLPLAASQITFCAIYLIPVALLTGAYSEMDATAGPIASLLLLGGLGSGIAIVAFMWLIQEAGPVRAAVVTYLMPPVGVFLGWLVLDEAIGWNLILGLAFIISGVALVQQVPVASLWRRATAFGWRAAPEPAD